MAAAGLPRVRVDETVHQALLAIMAGRLGLTLVVDDAGALGGILTDGDLKRILLARGTDDLFATPVGAVMNRAPRTIDGEALAAAVRAMEENEPGPITALVVVDPAGRPEGVLHLHDRCGSGCARRAFRLAGTFPARSSLNSVI